MDLPTFHSILTVITVIAFVAIFAWAWSGKRRQSFDQAARMPLEDDNAPEHADNAHSGTR
jgi:cytochrome c oxidase cbb3-type subunit 4